MTAHESSIVEYGVLQLATTSLSVLASHSTHRQTQSGSICFKDFQICLSFELAGRNEQFELINFIYFSFHVRRNCQDEETNTTLMKLAWLKRSTCTQCCIDKLTITKNSDGVPFCLQGFSCRKEAKVATLIWLRRREFLVQEVQLVLCC